MFVDIEQSIFEYDKRDYAATLRCLELAKRCNHASSIEYSERRLAELRAKWPNRELEN